jgi:hypothetical protein
MKKQLPVSPKPSHRLQPLGPPPSVADETDLLFPGLKASPVEPKLRPPVEYLGRNPYSELKRRAEHAQHLAAMDSETQAKIKEAQALLAARRGAQDALTHPAPSALTEAEASGRSVVLTAAEERRAALPPLRRTATPQQHQQRAVGSSIAALSDRAVSPLIPTAATIVSPLTRTTSPYWSSTGVSVSSGAACWVQEGVVIRAPLVTAADAKSSKAQLSKHKVGKHTGYFGEELLTASAKRIRKDETGEETEEESGGDHRSLSPHQQQQKSPLSFPGRVLTFTEPAERLWSLHPSTSSVDVCLNAQWTLDAFAVIDSPGLTMLFGRPSIPMTRVNVQLHRNSDACPKGNPASNPPAFLPDLRATVYGKPSGYWPGDAVTAELYLSRYAYTCKYVKIATSCKSYPNVFSQFGVDGEALELASPFPLRFLPGATSTAAQDAVELTLAYHAKSRSRVLRSAFPLPLFQGLVACDALLCVSGTASSISQITVELQLSIPDHVENFYFKSAAANLAFFDALDGTQRTFRLVQQQTPFSSTSTPLARHHSPTVAPLESRNDISFSWSLLRVPLMLKLFDQDPTLVMRGRLTHETSHRGVVLRSPSPSERSCTLWNFIKLQNLVAFIECIEGVTRFGVECVAEMDVSSGGASAGKTKLRFKGRLCAVITENNKALLSDTVALRSHVALPSTHFHFEGALEENAWNYIGGCSFVFLTDPVLHFTADAATLLPRDVHISGCPVLQMGDEGVGFSSEHSYSNNLLREKSVGVAVFPVDSLPHYVFTAPLAGTTAATPDRSVSLKCIVQSLLHPSALTHAATLSRDNSNNNCQIISVDCTEKVLGVLQAADRVHLHDAHIVINDSTDELVVSTAQARDAAATSGTSARVSATPRYTPGTRIVVTSATVWVHGAPCSASGVITLVGLQSGTNDSSPVVEEDVSAHHGAVQLDAVLQIHGNLLGSHGGAVGAVGCDSVGGVGPQYRLRLLIPSGPPPTPCVPVDSPATGEFQSIPQVVQSTNDFNQQQQQQQQLALQTSKASELVNYWEADTMVECSLQHALISLNGGSSLPLTEYRVAIHGPSSNNGEELVACRIAALCIPPRILLEHRPDVLREALHAFSHSHSNGGEGRGPGSRSIQDALSASYDVQVCLRTSAGTLFSSSLSPASSFQSQPLWDIVDSNVNMKLQCGIFEALQNAFFGKVAEFRVLCVRNRQHWSELRDASTSMLVDLEHELAHRRCVVAALDADTASLSKALSCATTEASLLAQYCRSRVTTRSTSDGEHPGLGSVASRAAHSDAADVAQQSSSHQDAVLLHHRKEVGAASSTKTLAISKFTSVASALSLMDTSLNRSLDAGVWRILKHYHSILINPYRSSEADAPPPASDGIETDRRAEGNATVLAHLGIAHLHYVSTSQQHAVAMVDAFATIAQQLEADEIVFPSLFALHNLSLSGGQRSVPGHDGAALSASCQSSSALTISLVVGGVLRGRVFRSQAALAALDHLSIVSAIDRLSSDMLKMYVSLLRFQSS